MLAIGSTLEIYPLLPLSLTYLWRSWRCLKFLSKYWVVNILYMRDGPLHQRFCQVFSDICLFYYKSIHTSYEYRDFWTHVLDLIRFSLFLYNNWLFVWCLWNLTYLQSFIPTFYFWFTSMYYFIINIFKTITACEKICMILSQKLVYHVYHTVALVVVCML